MRLFVVLRSVFFLLLLTASSVFVLHKHLCINYVPHRLNDFVSGCEGLILAISTVNGNSIDEVTSRTGRSADNLEPSSNVTLAEAFSAAVNAKEANETLAEAFQAAMNAEVANSFANALNATLSEPSSPELTLPENFTMVEKWHHINTSGETITLNVKTCFEFTISEIINSKVLKYSNIVSPLRLTLILMVTSFLVAILDLSLRMITSSLSLIQCLVHSLIQVVLWGAILLNMEMYRRGWAESWRSSGQTIEEIPMYPSEWNNFEVYAFIILLLSISEVVLFEHLSKKIKLVASQGIYKCIQQDDGR
ncbi:hypothetical protein CAEBREN_10663 [Caenorhabditis brenneri]|uniref:Uncharacterized protein n=1 Tax=Caenorhabditis brenneri TaxID=135651 RepID=G0MT78_CAEBE|nr:hypothetical protein CAEBREN_10663 [Caenorhabditis brenneri]